MSTFEAVAPIIESGKKLKENLMKEIEFAVGKLDAGELAMVTVVDRSPEYPGQGLDYQTLDGLEVQAVVRAAGKLGVPLWPVSTGKNLAYGGAAPLMPGTVVLDLKALVNYMVNN